MAIQSFNDRSLKDGKVPQSGSRSGAGPSGPGSSAKGTPKGVKQADGTANLRTTATTKRAEPKGSPSGGKNSIPSAVDKFNDDEV